MREEIIVNASTTAIAVSTSVYTTSAFWERLWRQSGLTFAASFLTAYLVYGTQPHIGAPADALSAFYNGNARGS